MKNWKLTLLAAAAALGLQACDVSVNDKPAAGPAATSETAPAPAAATESTAPAETTAAAPAAAPTDGSLPSTDASGTMAAQTPPASPDTGAMGAPGATGTSPLGAAPAASTSSDGVAAPTELARFLQENPVKPRDPEAASAASDEGKSGATKAEGKGSKS